MKTILESRKIGNLEIKNRIIRSATYEAMASEDGYITDDLLKLYKNLAEGGAGLIITGNAYIHPNGKTNHRQIGAYHDDLIPGLKKLSEIVHNHGEDCKIALQINHCGRQSFLLQNTFAPSAIQEGFTKNMPREMTIAEIRETIEAFAEAARRAKEAGFDAIQLHSAHGYLLSEFLSPFTNRRTDEYGGNTENRVKIIEEIYKRSVELVGEDFPILIKINVDDFLEGGLTLDESKKVAEKLSKIGFAAIEISGAMWEVALRKRKELGWKPSFLPESRTNIGIKNNESYHLPYAKEIKKVIEVPLIIVGGLRSLDNIEEILIEGSVDFIALCRPLIREPDLPNKWLNGIGPNMCECISCNGCVASVTTGGLHCTQKKKLNQNIIKES